MEELRMEIEQIALGLQETKDLCLRNEGRIIKLEADHGVLHQLATSVAVMAEKMTTMNTNLDVLSHKVDELEDKPAKRWDGLVDKIIAVVAGAVVGIVLAKFGL